MSIYLDIKKSFKDFTLEVKFENNIGTLGILGPSGCGKSLTLKCLAGLETPDEGVIKVGNKTVFDSSAKINIKPQQRNVGYLFQSYALFPNMTVKENIEIAMKKDKPGREKKIEDLINRYEINGLENRYPVNLSGGQQQRVALARIFAYEPEIILLDEPFSALDTFLRDSMQAKLLDIIDHYSGDVIMVTHNRDEAYKICDRLLVFDSGRIMGDGKSDELFKNPQSVQVAKITGCKNIAEIKKVSEDRVYVKDWEVELCVNGPVDDNTHIGIRAHYFSTEKSPKRDEIKVRAINEIVGPFEKNVLLRNPDIKNGKDIWWICNKEQNTDNLKYLYIDKKDIYLLKDKSLLNV